MILLVCEPGDTNPGWRSKLLQLNSKYFGFSAADYHTQWWWAAHQDDKLVGFAGAKDDGNGRLFLGLCGVIPEARGQGIHKQFIEIREKFAKNRSYREILTYVDLGNNRSANNFIKAGFELTWPWRPGHKMGDFLFLRKAVPLK